MLKCRVCGRTIAHSGGRGRPPDYCYPTDAQRSSGLRSACHRWALAVDGLTDAAPYLPPLDDEHARVQRSTVWGVLNTALNARSRNDR